MDEIRIRKATIDDIPELLRQRRALLAGAESADEQALDAMVAAARDYFARALADGSFHAWLAEAGGEVLGGGAVVVHAHPPSAREPLPRRAHLLNVYTHPAHRRRGVARRVMDAALAWCRAGGFVTLTLHATDEGRPLYEQLGFRPTNEMRLRLR